MKCLPWLLFLLAVCSGATFPSAAHAAESKRPNIVIILGDDMGFSDLGCYGSEIRTPNLDALAAGGLKYTSFYNATRCCPSRASILTGLYPHQAGVADMAGNNPKALPAYRGHLLPSTVTIAGALRPAGYRTMAVGKWHVGMPPGPVQAGFEDFYGFRGDYAVDFFDPRMMIRLPANHPDTRTYEPGKYYSTDAITDHALDFIADARKTTPDAPFFLYLAYNAAHFPLQAPREEIEKYAHTYEKGWDAIRTERLGRLKKLGVLPPDTDLSPRSIAMNSETTRRDGFEGKQNPAWDSLDPDRQADLARRMAIYAATIDRMDQQVGRVVADLKAHGELENTLIFFLADNGACAEWDPYGFDMKLDPNRHVEPGAGLGGNTEAIASVLHKGADLEALGGPGTFPAYGSGWANACNTPFRLYKHYIHEGGISTPLIVHWPAGFAAHGEMRPQVGHVMDLMATCLDVAGAKYPEKKDGHDITPTPGVSLRPTFASREAAVEHPYIAWEHEGNRAVRRGKWKLVALEGGPWELYDIEADRTEQHNLTATQPQTVTELTKLYGEWAEKVGVKPIKEPKDVSLD